MPKKNTPKSASRVNTTPIRLKLLASRDVESGCGSSEPTELGALPMCIAGQSLISFGPSIMNADLPFMKKVKRGCMRKVELTIKPSKGKDASVVMVFRQVTIKVKGVLACIRGLKSALTPSQLKRLLSWKGHRVKLTSRFLTANLVHFNHGDKQWNSADDPLRTVTTGNHAALVYSFLCKYFGTKRDGAPVNEPMHTVTSKDRFGLVTVTVDGEEYVIVDIGLRMLTPRELARAQGFPDEYVLTGTKSSQVARIGNSVCPAMAESIVRANVRDAEAEGVA